MKNQKVIILVAASCLLSLFHFTKNADAGWTRICQGGQLDSGVYITALGANDNAVFIGTSWGNIFQSSVNSVSWKIVNYVQPNILDTMRWNFPTLHPSSFAFSGTKILIGTSSCGLYISSDNGITWQPIDIGLPSVGNIDDATFFSTSGNTIYARFHIKLMYNRLFSSGNNGNSWTALNTDLNIVGCRMIAPSGSIIAAGGSYGVYTSANNGVSWVPANYGLADMRVNCLIVCGNTLFAGTESGVYVSTTNGTSWQAANTGMPKYCYIHTFSVSGSKIFAGTDDGIFLSQDNGASWTDVGAGLSGTFSFLTTNTAHLYALDGSSYSNLTYGINVYSRPLSEMSKVAAPPSSQSTSGLFKIASMNGQGPASISFDLTSPSQVSVAVLSASGKMIATVFEGMRSAGTQNISWSHAGLSTGLYLVYLKTGKRVMVQKLHVL